jgi:hypothetical protein
MAKTYQSLINEVREILQDTDPDGYRYPDSVLLNKLNRGLQELGRLRPDAYWDLFDGVNVAIPEIVATDPDLEDATQIGLDQPLQVEMQFYTPLVYFVVGSAELVDDEFTVDGRAGTLLSNFKGMVLSL